MSSHQVDDWNPDSAMFPPPRFLGSVDGQGARDSLVTTSTAAHSDGLGSVYALNNNNQESYSSRGSPRTASAPLVSPFRDVPHSPTGDVYDPSVPLSTTPSPPRLLSEKEYAYADPASRSRRKRIFILAAIVAVILIAVAVAVPLATIKHHSNTSAAAVSPGSQSSSAGSAKPTSSSSPNKAIVTGGDGSVITMEDGTKFTYTNKFGGQWYWDPNDPINDSAQSQSWTPALNQAFNWGVDHVRG
jgi:glucan 1,3-beta-glucosidase